MIPQAQGSPGATPQPSQLQGAADPGPRALARGPRGAVEGVEGTPCALYARFVRLLFPLVLALVGCVDGGVLSAGEPEGDSEAPPPDADTPPLELRWLPCPLFTGGDGLDAECGTAEVPLDWDEPDGEAIDLFVKRHGDPEASVQLWMLNGGPGAAGNGYEHYAQVFVQAAPDDLVVYLPDHRGVGRSTRLGCFAEGDGTPGGFGITDAEWPGCQADVLAEWGPELAHFRTTAAARDLGHLIEATRADGQDVHVHGGSYGSYHAQRYLQLFPDQATGVSLLGVVAPTFSFDDYGVGYEQVGRAYLDACAGDSGCRGRLGPDPAGLAEQVLPDPELACPGVAGVDLSRDRLRRMFGGILLWSWWERAAIPAVVRRLDRCSDTDVAALRYLGTNLWDPLSGLSNDRLYGRVLGVNVSVGELWDHPGPSVGELEAFEQELLFAPSSGLRHAQRIADGWPRYDEDGLDDLFAQTATPILMLQGELDPASPLAQAEAVGAAYDGADQHFVVLPGAPHSFESPTWDGWSCALNAMFSFALDPSQLLDCVDDVRPPDFEGSPELGQLLFGRDSLWE